MASSRLLLAAVLLLSAAPALAQSTSANSTPAPARAAARAANEGERVEIPGEDKRILVGSFYAPRDPKAAGTVAPTALLVHDAGGRRSDLNELADRLQRQGFAVLSLDLRNHGESVAKDKPWNELTDEEKAKTWNLALRDVKSGLDWLRKCDNVQRVNIALLGDRAGCTLVALTAARNENVGSMVLLDPPTEQYGIDVTKAVQSVPKLPTYVAVTKEAQPKAEVIAATREKTDDGMKYVEIAVFKGVVISPCSDKRLPTDIVKFMVSKTTPKKIEK